MNFSEPTSTQTVNVSVAIPCFGHEGALETTLGHIFACHPLPAEVLLHFDGGWEPARDFSIGAPVPVRVFKSRHNIGPGGGRDLLFKQAEHDVVCSFDDDSWPVDGDYFTKAKTLMEAFPRAAVLSPAVYLREKPKIQQLAEVSEVVGFEGSASITRRSLYLTLPGYVPVPDAYGVEEVDLSLQAHAAGYQILSSPWLRAWHDRPYSDYEHGLVPWVKNEVLLAYLRYPGWLQPWGWLRSVRHVMNHWSPGRLGLLLRALAASPAHCESFRSYVKRYGVREILNHHYSPRQHWTIQVGDEGIVLTPAAHRGRAMYIQYTNPAAYPPLEHSAMQLAAHQWQVRFAGLYGRNATQMEFPPFPRIEVCRMQTCQPGFKQKIHYMRYALWCVWHALLFRPDWLYCSEPLSALPARLIRALLGTRVLYHEHDTPAGPTSKDKWFSRFSWRQRQRLASRAEIIVLPNQARLEAFQLSVPLTGQSFCVWNCPSRHETEGPSASSKGEGPMRILYHGSIVPERFPPLMLEALAECGEDLKLRLIGYEVPGMIGYTDRLKADAERLGIADRFEYLGTIPQRSDLMARAAECDVGLSLLQFKSSDINMRHMAGASNKPFDYLSQGLALIVPNDAEWETLFVANGCARSCVPDNKAALVEVFRWLAAHRDEVRAMGERGREQVREVWNYESQFAPVLAVLETKII